MRQSPIPAVVAVQRHSFALLAVAALLMACPAPGVAQETWTPTRTTGAPTPRASHSAVWTGSAMIVWGGSDGSNLNTGGIYDPAADSWRAMNATGAPTPRTYPAVVWTGAKVIVWGGVDAGGYTNTGGIYDPGADSWTAMSTTGAPSPRFEHTAVWTGSRMIVWGGWDPTYTNTGGIYDPETDHGWQRARREPPLLGATTPRCGPGRR